MLKVEMEGKEKKVPICSNPRTAGKREKEQDEWIRDNPSGMTPKTA